MNMRWSEIGLMSWGKPQNQLPRLSAQAWPNLRHKKTPKYNICLIWFFLFNFFAFQDDTTLINAFLFFVPSALSFFQRNHIFKLPLSHFIAYNISLFLLVESGMVTNSYCGTKFWRSSPELRIYNFWKKNKFLKFRNALLLKK